MAAGCVAGRKATGEAQRAHQSSPQLLWCVWMSQHPLLAQCWSSSHHPGFHSDDRSAAGVSQAAGCLHLHNWIPLKLQTAHPQLLAEGTAQTWGASRKYIRWKGSLLRFVHRCAGFFMCLSLPIRVQRHTELLIRKSCAQTCWSFKNFKWYWEMIDDLHERKQKKNMPYNFNL